MHRFFEAMEKSGLELYINSLVKKLAQTKGEDDFYSAFLEIINRMMPLAGENKGVLETVKRAFERRIPMTQVARLLVQDRLSERVREKLADNFFVSWIMDARKRNKLKTEHFKAPWFFVISPTFACNLRCYGCYAHEYQRGQGMSFETFDRIIREAERLGIRFLTISGGEPFFWRDLEAGKNLLDIAARHKGVFFQVYTNGTFLTEPKTVERLAEVGNIAPAISQEGFAEETNERRGKCIINRKEEWVWDAIQKAREELYSAGVLQGFSVTATRQNSDVITSNKFIESLIDQNVSFGWFFTYIPIGREPKIELMQTPRQRLEMGKAIWKWRAEKPIFIGDFWNDGPWVGGCIAGGRRYFHINALGDIEPCVFAHFATDNIYRLWENGKGLKEAITSPFFHLIREKQLEIGNWLSPCCIIDHPNILREAVRVSRAYPTHKGAETVIGGEIAQFLIEYGEKVQEITKDAFEKMEGGGWDTEATELSKIIRNHRARNIEEYNLMFNTR